MSDRPIIIVRKKKGVHGRHHGGSWKVAYADFVTAMMAFFMVMWILSMDEGMKDMVQGYFQNPVGFKNSFSGGTNPLSAGNFITNMDVKRTVIINRREQERRFEEAATHILTQLEEGGLLQGVEAEVEISISEDGLRIELMETGGEGMFFRSGSSELTSALRSVIGVVSKELAKLPSEVVIEGHTDALPFGEADYSNWELSVDRANAARREMVAAGLPEIRLAGVRGYAARRPKITDNPVDARNRRITVLLPFLEANLDSLTVVPGEVPWIGPDIRPLSRIPARRRDTVRTAGEGG